MKLGVCGGHFKGHNVIPKQFQTKPQYKTYCEGTVMHDVAGAVCKALPQIYNARPEDGHGPAAVQVPSFLTRAKRFKAAGCDVAVEFHSNWSMHDSKTPNHGVMLAIVSLCYEAGAAHEARCNEEKALATKLFKPMADAMKLKFEVRTRDSGSRTDYYGFIRNCKKYGVAHPIILENGYHLDFADDVPGNTAKVVQRFKEIVGVPMAPPPPAKPPTPTPTVHITHVFAEGETLWSIARNHGVHWDTLRLEKEPDAKNPLSPTEMHAGDVLRIK
jgi:hypothetical protein